MSPRATSYGKCFLCGETLAKNAANRHLQKCLLAHPDDKKGKPERLFHIRVEGADAPIYWLNLEIPASATLETLDNYLRAIWLECCGHLSAFEIGGQRFEVSIEGADFSFYDEPPKAMKTARLEKVLSVGLAFTHEYDFGSTTMLKLKVVDERTGILNADKRNVHLLARNYAPDFRCQVCNEPAEYFYVFEYPYEPFCEGDSMEKDEEGLLPIVNSPRTGECGYDGPYDEALAFDEKYSN